jgi:hypothetical protein
MTPTSTNLVTWTERVKTLEQSLARRRRGDLLPVVGLLLRVLEVGGDGDRTADVQSLMARVLAEVKGCLEHPERVVSSTLFAEMDGLLDGAEKAREAWASDLLADIGSAGDAELDALTSAVKALEPMAPRDELGTLREPLNRSGVGKGGAPARVLMKGELHPGLLADLIQLFAQNTETGLLLIDGAEARASIYFKDGVIVDTLCGDDSGEKGFFRSMHIREGRFSYQRGVEAENVRIFRSAQHLIMDTLRMMDEAS